MKINSPKKNACCVHHKISRSATVKKKRPKENIFQNTNSAPSSIQPTRVWATRVLGIDY